MKRMKKWAAGLALTAALATTACAPLQEHRGYKFDDKIVERLENGMTRQQVRGLLGSPSTTSTVENEAWYYIFSRVETVTFFEPEEVERRIIAVEFDETKTVQKIAHYGLEDGKIVNFIDRTTPTRGKELTVLGEIFGNLGKFNKPAGGSGKPGGR